MKLIIKGLDKLDKLAKDLAKARVASEVSALNKLARKGRTDAIKKVKKIYTIKEKARFGKALILTTASRIKKPPVAILRINDNKPIGYASFKHRGTLRSGVTVQLRKDRPGFKLKTAFIATANQATGQIFMRSIVPGHTAKTGHRTRAGYSKYKGQKRDRVLRPKGPSPNRMMRDVGFPELEDKLDVDKFGNDLSTALVLQLKKKGF